jgi:arsenite/tail-anchored protein-transporting ATPase
MNKLAQMLQPIDGKKFLFFGGKGGVGKTTMAAATAVWMADRGYKTTIVSTDPTVSLSAIFHQKISAVEKTKIVLVDNLYGVNINPSEATGVFQGRLSKTLGGLTNTIGGDLISVPCAEEMAAFDQFVEFLDDDESEVVVFDTAPTGHSLRELSLPFNWADFLQKQVEERKELAVLMRLGDADDASSQLELEKKRYERAIKVLKNGGQTIYSLVLLPAYLPIAETLSATKDLGGLGISVPSFIVNQLIPRKEVMGNRFLQARLDTQEKYMTEIERNFGQGFIRKLLMLDTDVHDVNTLRMIGKNLYEGDD